MELANEEIASFEATIEVAEAVLALLKTELQWDEDDLRQQAEDLLVECPIDADHRVAPDQLERHTSKCRRRRYGDFVHESQEVAYRSAPAVVRFTQQIKPEEEEQHYQHWLQISVQDRARNHTENAAEANRIRSARTNIRELVHDALEADLVQEEADMSETNTTSKTREYKRRRQSYKGKAVQKTAVEATRELINTRMHKLQKLPQFQNKNALSS